MRKKLRLTECTTMLDIQYMFQQIVVNYNWGPEIRDDGIQTFGHTCHSECFLSLPSEGPLAPSLGKVLNWMEF